MISTLRLHRPRCDFHSARLLIKPNNSGRPSGW